MHSCAYDKAKSLVLMACLLTLAKTGCAESTTASHEPGGVLSLSQVLDLALANNPELQASLLGAQALEAMIRQSYALANPELEVEAEEFGGKGARKGYEGAKTTLRLSQELEMGGRRGSRQRVAAAESRMARLEYESTRLNVIMLTKKAYVDVLLAQGQSELAGSLFSVATNVQQAVVERVKAGKVPPLEESKAGVEVATARIALAKAGRDLDSARERLIALCGGATPVFKAVAGTLGSVGVLPPVSDLISMQSRTPEYTRGTEEVSRGRDALAEARAKRFPGIRVSAGLSRFEDDGSHAGIVSMAVPLPLFDRNAGGIAAAGHSAARAEHEQRAVRSRARTELMEACNRCEMAREEAHTLMRELLPAAQQAFEAARIGYQAGKFGHLEVLDAQRMLAEARIRTLSVMAEYHKAVADVERLAGISLITIQ